MSEHPTGTASAQPSPPTTTRILFDPRNVARAGGVVVLIIVLVLLARFVLEDGGTILFNVLMAWFAAIAMEPAVVRLARRMPRGAATALVMLTFVLAVLLFLFMFGRLFIDQLAQLVTSVPDLVAGVLDRVNKQFGTDYKLQDALDALNITPAAIASYASQIAGGLLGVLGSIVGSVFGLFTFALFTFYLSADSPRLRRWLASLFPPGRQTMVVQVWDLTAEKTGSYVAARVILATLNSTASGIAFYLIGLPYWLPLAIWTGVVAQFVPTIGTYISIVLPVVVGLLSNDPADGLWVLAFGLAYQQVENLTFEPKISARAVDVHPMVAFVAVLLGAALFGVAGALLAVPVTAMLLALFDIYARRYEVLPELAEAPELPLATDQIRGMIPDRDGAGTADEAPADESRASASD